MLSVVIPTLNESGNIARTIRHTLAAAGGAPLDLVVSDCDSTDDTAAIAAGLGARLVTGSKSRWEALNRGVSFTRGEGLLFLHADTLLPAGFAAAVLQALGRPGVVGGAFSFRFQRQPPTRVLQWKMLGLVALMNNVRFRTSRNFYGDQAIFVHKSVFNRVGGFPERTLLEDLHFSRQMKRLGVTAILSPAVYSSPRRFLARGIIHQTIQDIRLILADSMGLNAEGLMTRYNRWNHRQFRSSPTSSPQEV